MRTKEICRADTPSQTIIGPSSPLLNIDSPNQDHIEIYQRMDTRIYGFHLQSVVCLLCSEDLLPYIFPRYILLIPTHLYAANNYTSVIPSLHQHNISPINEDISLAGKVIMAVSHCSFSSWSFQIGVHHVRPQFLKYILYDIAWTDEHQLQFSSRSCKVASIIGLYGHIIYSEADLGQSDPWMADSLSTQPWINTEPRLKKT